MHTNILHRIASLPGIRDVLGAVGGCAVALALYVVFQVVRGAVNVGPVDVVGGLHAAALSVGAHATLSLGFSSTIALAAACAFIHRRAMMSEID